MHGRLVALGGRGVRVRRLGGDRAGEIRITWFRRNRSASLEEMVTTAVARTQARVTGRHVLAIQDTTTVRAEDGGRCVALHPVIAVDAIEEALLGLVDARFFRRAGAKRAWRDGILWNELYIGRLIYNRQSFVKDPDTGRHLPRPNSHIDWVMAEVPDLRIIDQGLWDRVHAIKARACTQKLQNHRRPKRLLSGLIRCGVCGGAHTVIGEERLCCAVHREKALALAARQLRSASSKIGSSEA